MKNYLVLFSILFIALMVRIYNFSDRLTFGPEQARSLMVSANYIKDKPSLLGQEYFRVNSLGHKLYTSAIFNYSLVPFILLFNYDPLPISYYFAMLNIITGVVLYLVAKKIFNQFVAVISLFLFLFNSTMIYHSMFIWVLNYLPLIGILSVYFAWKLIKNKYKLFDILMLGVLSGIGFGLQYLYLIAILIILAILFRYSKNRIVDIFAFTLGGIVGDITRIVFDLKHNFYHLRTLWQYAVDTINGVSDAGFTYYHFLHFWPVLILAIGLILWQIYIKNKYLFILLTSAYLFINLNSTFVSFDKPVGMIDGLTIADIKNASEIIAKNAKYNFNVVTLYDFDTRGYTLRYYLEHVYNKKPLSDVEYQSASEIYALAKANYDFDNNNPWELNVYKPYNVVTMESIGDGFVLSKIVK